MIATSAAAARVALGVALVVVGLPIGLALAWSTRAARWAAR